MPKGDKYRNLTKYLIETDSETIELTFQDLEDITGGLPPSVYKYRLAWSDKSQHSFSYGWLRAGYSIKADFANQKAVFRKIKTVPKPMTPELSFLAQKASPIKRGSRQAISFHITEDDVNQANQSVKNDPVYGSEGEAIERIIRRFPGHGSIDEIIIKLAVIDVTHSTQIFKQKQRATIIQLAQAIMNIESIDQRIQDGDIRLVTDIAKATSVGFLSIASKYCACHNQSLYNKDAYFKYDSVVSGQIKYRIRDYKEYYSRLERIIDENNLRSVPNIRQKLDHYFWYKNRKREHK